MRYDAPKNRWRTTIVPGTLRSIKRWRFDLTFEDIDHLVSFLCLVHLHSEAIRVNPECSASVRVGLGLCFYKLGQTSRAQAAMARALQLDPQNVQALVGSAILELSTASSGSNDAARRTESAINTMSMAYHVDPKNAMVLNHLANHYFWTWSPLKATLRVEQGSCSGTVSGDLKHDLVTGDTIRIGSGFVTAVGEEGFDGTTLHLREAFTEPSGDKLKLYTKDYRKVGLHPPEGFEACSAFMI